MNLIHLRYFVELSRTGSYTQAAKQLCITQPSLSHAMAQLEEELGAPLFRRQGRTTALTPLGEQFLTAVRQSLDVLDRGIEEVRQAARGAGLLRIGMVRPLAVELVPKLAGAFLKERPEGEVRFTFHTDVTHALLAQLEAGELDAVFSSPPPEQLGLSSCSVGRQDLVVIVPENHPLAGRKEIDLGEILDTPLVAFSQNTGLRDVVDGLFARAGRVPLSAYETEDDEAIAGLVAGGFGAAVVPDMELLKRLPVRALAIRTPVWERKFCLVWDDRRSTPLLEQFCRFVAGQGEFVVRE